MKISQTQVPPAFLNRAYRELEFLAHSYRISMNDPNYAFLRSLIIARGLEYDRYRSFGYRPKIVISTLMPSDPDRFVFQAVEGRVGYHTLDVICDRKPIHR